MTLQRIQVILPKILINVNFDLPLTVSILLPHSQVATGQTGQIMLCFGIEGGRISEEIFIVVDVGKHSMYFAFVILPRYRQFLNAPRVNMHQI